MDFWNEAPLFLVLGRKLWRGKGWRKGKGVVEVPIHRNNCTRCGEEVTNIMGAGNVVEKEGRQCERSAGSVT